MDALVGAVLEGAYRITRLIGEGGMGAVYEAVQLRLNKRVAVKLMARDLAANREALARFHREAEITSHLGHPHLVTVFDFGQAESGEPYLVMEYLDGEDLDLGQRLGDSVPDAEGHAFGLETKSGHGAGSMAETSMRRTGRTPVRRVDLGPLGDDIGQGGGHSGPHRNRSCLSAGTILLPCLERRLAG